MRERRGGRAPRARRLALLAALVALPACARAQGGGGAPSPSSAALRARADTASLRRSLDSLANAHRGTVGYVVHNLETGERLARRADETFPTASLIKVPILVTVFDLVERGQLSLDDELTVLGIDKVPGSGILQHLHDGARITVRDAAWLMSTISDNTATNLLLDRIIIRRVWEKMEALGLPHTKVHSKSFLRISSVAMDSSVKYGLGVTTPDEMARLFALLGEGRAVTPAADSTMLHILAHNDHLELLQRHVVGLPGVSAAFKTGSTDSVRTECALWRVPARVVGCVLTKGNQDIRWVIDSEPQLLLARMGELMVRAWYRPEKQAAQ
jgi:beta-lactamase class A